MLFLFALVLCWACVAGLALDMLTAAFRDRDLEGDRSTKTTVLPTSLNYFCL